LYFEFGWMDGWMDGWMAAGLDINFFAHQSLWLVVFLSY